MVKYSYFRRREETRRPFSPLETANWEYRLEDAPEQGLVGLALPTRLDLIIIGSCQFLSTIAAIF
jgi:hypothetical protein